MLTCRQVETEVLRKELKQSFGSFDKALYQCRLDWPRMRVVDERGYFSRYVLDPIAARYGKKYGWACDTFFAHDVYLFANQAVMSHGFADVLRCSQTIGDQRDQPLLAAQSDGRFFAVIKPDNTILLEKGFQLFDARDQSPFKRVDVVLHIHPQTTFVELWDAAARRGPRRLHQSRPSVGKQG
jgi:hypothetical protein